MMSKSKVRVLGEYFAESCMGSGPQLLLEHPGRALAAFSWHHPLPQASHVPGVNVTEEEIQAQLGQSPARASLVDNTHLVH